MQPLYRLTHPQCCMYKVLQFNLHLVIPCSSVVEQVTQFTEYLAPKPAGATWDSTNSLFAIWIGINDVVRTFFTIMPIGIIKYMPREILSAGWVILIMLGRGVFIVDCIQSNISRPEFYGTLMDRLFSQVGKNVPRVIYCTIDNIPSGR